MQKKTTLISGLAVLALTFVASEAMAQRTTTLPNFNQRIPSPALTTTTMEEWNRTTLKRGTKQILVSDTRLSRATRLAGLLNQGRCADAYNLAIDEHDNKLASRVTELCTPRS